MIRNPSIFVGRWWWIRFEELTRESSPHGHVYTLHAELEGMKLAPMFEKLMDGWQGQGHELVSLGDYLESIGSGILPRHEIAVGPVPGRSGTLALQGREFLAAHAAA